MSKSSDTQLQKDLEEIFSSSGNLSQLQPISTHYSNSHSFSSNHAHSTQSSSHSPQSSCLLPPAPTNIATSMSLEFELKMDKEYELLFEKTHQLEFENSAAVVIIKTYWQARVAKLEQYLMIQKKDMTDFKKIFEIMNIEMNEMKTEKDACFEESDDLREALEKKTEVNRDLIQQVANLTEKRNAEFSSFQKSNITKKNKIISLEKTINEKSARIRELQQMDHNSHKKMKLQEKEHEEGMYKKESELRNSRLCEKQSLDEIEDYKNKLSDALEKAESSDSKLLKFMQKHIDVLEKKIAFSKENSELLKEREQYKRFNTLLQEKLAEERKQNLEKQKNGE